MRFEDLLSRADDGTLQDILGPQTVRILTKLDPNSTYNNTLRQVVLELLGVEGLLLNKGFRGLLVDLLRPGELLILANLLQINTDLPQYQLYEAVKNTSLVRGSPREENLFNFFELNAPPVDRQETPPSIKDVGAQYPLFSHQRIAAKKVQTYLKQEPYRVLLHMPTGSGKTRTAMNIIAEHLREREPTIVVWLAGSDELCEQALEEFVQSWEFLGNRQISTYRLWGNYSFDISQLSDGFVVAGFGKTYSLIRSGDTQFISQLGSKCSLVVMDEAHQAVAPSYRTVLDVLYLFGRENRLLGLSATPGRTWSDIQADMKLAEFFAQRKVTLQVEGYHNPVDYLIAEGYLARPTFRKLSHGKGNLTPADLEAIREVIDIPIGVLKKLGKDDQRNLQIVIEAEKLAKQHQRIIIFTPSVESSNVLASTLRVRGLDAYTVTGETPATVRRRCIETFKNDDPHPKILCNYGVLTTGFDAPKTSAAIIARPTLSLVLYSQMVGRAIRGERAGGNREAEIVTLVDTQLPGFDSISNAFNNWEDVWHE